MKVPRRRIDVLMCERGLAESREKAKALLLAGSVRVNGQPVEKAGAEVRLDAVVEVAEALPYVSRGGFKLAAALDHWGIDPKGWVCADIGASTGGFTDVLLQRGAARVHAVDVGEGQIHWRLRTDRRVVLHEKSNARFLRPDSLGEKVRLAVCDVSFISVTLILPALMPLLEAPRQFIALIKPQFEAGRSQVGKGGIVRDPAVHAEIVERVQRLVESFSMTAGVIDSPILGAEGNKEFLLYGADPNCRDHREA
jgi:23S rRNA (cytidine1920-2'-O)/16S rRNA (cytidine1409-2'-O)-methyltransferase